MSELREEDDHDFGPPSSIADHEGLSFTFYLPKEGDYEHLAGAYAELVSSLREVANEHGGKTWKDTPPPWSGAHEIVAVWLAGSVAWEVFKLVGSRFHRALQDSRMRKLGVMADVTSIVFAAWEEVRLTSDEFRTDWEVTQVMVDGNAQALDDGVIPYTGFPTGIHLVRVPNLATGNTHIIEIRSDGEVLAHEVRPYLTEDAVEYLAKE